MIASGHAGSAPVTAPNVSSTASQTMWATPTDVPTPPDVQSRPSPSSVRAKSAKRKAVPSRAGANELSSEPQPYRAAESILDVRPPHRCSAERQAQPEAASESAKPSAAVQSQAGLAAPRPAKPFADLVAQELRHRGDHGHDGERGEAEGELAPMSGEPVCCDCVHRLQRSWCETGSCLPYRHKHQSFTL